MKHDESDKEVKGDAKLGDSIMTEDDKEAIEDESKPDLSRDESLHFMEVDSEDFTHNDLENELSSHRGIKQETTELDDVMSLEKDDDEREEAERRERSEEVKAWLSGEEYSQSEKPKSRMRKKVLEKKEIILSGLGAKKKHSTQKNGNSEEMNTRKLLENFDKILKLAENKINEIQNILNDHENDKKEIVSLFTLACQGEINNNYKKYLEKHYNNSDEPLIVKNLTRSINLISVTIKLEDLLYASIQRQLKTRQLVTEFARDFTKENFQDDEIIDLKTVDSKIREKKRLRDFYDTMTIISYHGLMAELALRVAILITTLKSFAVYESLLNDYPLDYSRYKDIDERILNAYEMLFNNIFSELIIIHDDDCPNDADDNLKAAYQLNNETADFYEKIIEKVAEIVDKMSVLKDYLAEKNNYTTEKREELLSLIKNVTVASENFESTLEKELQSNNPTIRELKDFIKLDTETITSETLDSEQINNIPKTLTMLSIRGTSVASLIENYNVAKEQKKDLLWKALEAKEKYLPEILALITALGKIYQLENERRTMINSDLSLPEREMIEIYYRKCTGFFETIFRNLTSIATYVYNVVQHQLTDIATDAPDGELVHTLDYICEALKEICRRFLDEHHMDLAIFVYRNVFKEPENEDFLYFAEVEKQVVDNVQKYWPATLMPAMSEASEAMTRANVILNKYNKLNVQPSEIREAMTIEEKKEIASIITEVRANVDHFMSWHTENGIGSLYSLYDFTIYSPETLINRANPKELATIYLATSEDNSQGAKLLAEEKRIEKEIQKLTKSDKAIYMRLNECVDSYQVMLKMFRQFYTLFNQRNMSVLKEIQNSNEDKIFDKKLLICDKTKAPQIKNVLVNFVRSYVRFSKQFLLLVKEYINTIENFYLDLPRYEKDTLVCLEYTGTFLLNTQKTLVGIRAALIIIQNDQDPMIAKYMKTMLTGIEKCWVGDFNSETLLVVSKNLNTVMEKLITKSESITKSGITKSETKELSVALQYDIEPLEKWVKEKLKD